MLDPRNTIQNLDYGWSMFTAEEFEKRLGIQGAHTTQEVVQAKLEKITKSYPNNRPLQALSYMGALLFGGVSYGLILWGGGTVLNKIAARTHFPLSLPIPSMTEKEGGLLILALSSFLVCNHYNERYSMGDLARQLQDKC